MTLIEMAIVTVVVAVGLFLLVGWTDGVRAGSKHDLAVRTLAKLDQALARYHRAEGVFPPAQPSRSSALQPTVYLLNHEKTRPLLESLPRALWRGPGRRTLVDPWGTELNYETVAGHSPLALANEGRPVFVSAGPDRAFGDLDDPTAVGDNLRSDDPGPDGFRPRFLTPDLSVDEGQAVGEQEDDRPN